MSMTIRDPLIIGNTKDLSAKYGNMVQTAATGSTVADAAALSSTGYQLVSGADATKGVKLPALGKDGKLTVKNNAAAVLKVYPPTGAAINGLSANAAISIAANTVVEFTWTSDTQIYTAPLLPS